MSEVLRTIRQIGRAAAMAGQLGIPTMVPASAADILPNQSEHAVKPIVWQASPDYLRSLQPIEISLPGETTPVKPQAPQKQEPPTPTQTICLGDVTGDGRTDITDLVAIASKVGQPPETLGDKFFIDINGDGRITEEDVAIVASNYGCQKEATPTPSPIETPSLIHESDQITRLFPEYQEKIVGLSANDRVAIIGANGEEIFLYNLTGRQIIEGRILNTMWLMQNVIAEISLDIHTTMNPVPVQIHAERQSFTAMTFVALAGSDEKPFWGNNSYGQTRIVTDEEGRVRIGSYAFDGRDVSISQVTITDLCNALVHFDAYQEIGCTSVVYAAQSALSGIRYVDYETNLSNMYSQTPDGALVLPAKLSYEDYMKFAELGGPIFQ